jgi:acetyl-CoA synthetase
MHRPRTQEAALQMQAAALSDPAAFWGEAARALRWFAPPEQTLSADWESASFSWFEGGKLNVAWNCLDRHLPARANQAAFIWAKDAPGEYETITYGALAARVARFANALKAEGVQKGDRVCIYLPMVPDLPAAMLACARIGAIHSVVFAGFSAEALRDRILDADCRVVITANEGLRGGRRLHLKQIVDRAVEGTPVRRVLVSRRTEAQVHMHPVRDRDLDEVLAAQRPVCPAEWMDAEDPLFILYTSGSTGRPKGVMHTTAGYLLYAAWTHGLVFDIQEGDVYFCAADIGWVTGHSYIVYGPLANGATSVMFESVPTFPDAGRYWQIVEDLKVTQFYTAPTALRAIAREGDAHVRRHDRRSLRVLGSVGEPINPGVWQWYHDVVGEGRCAVVDTWWQTETGGMLIAPIPGLTSVKPGSATLPLPGVDPVLVDDQGKILVGNGVRGNLCLRSPWPGQARSVWGDHDRFRMTYFTQFPGLYFTGDGAIRDEDGLYWITGRVDDVLNVSGHRLGTAEVESALVSHPAVAEAAVVGYPHDIKGEGIYAYVLLNPGEDKPDLVGALKQVVREVIGPFAAPDRVHIAAGLPKTRSGKIMRRILRKVAAGEYGELGDVSTLADPTVVDRLIEEHQALG